MNKNAKYVIWAVAALAVIGLGFLLFSPSGGGGGAQVEVVSGDQLATLAADGVRVIDVRTAGEYEAGHVPGAENIAVDQLAGSLGSLDPQAPVAVYCATGSRSSAAVETLKQAGFTKIYHFDQGMVAWTGDVEQGASVAAAPPVDQKPTATPVMYEFYTDW